MSAALLLLNAPAPDKKLLRAAARQADLIACADGGIIAAVSAGLTPDIVIGDMDSRPKTLPELPGTVYLCDFDEHRSDFEKALDWLHSASFRRVFVWGVRGGRVDHERVNWSVLRAWSEKLELTAIGGGVTRLLGPGKYRFTSEKGRIASLTADGASAVVTTRGLLYPLKKEKITPGSRGLSNRCAGKGFGITVHAGRVWVDIP